MSALATVRPQNRANKSHPTRFGISRRGGGRGGGSVCRQRARLPCRPSPVAAPGLRTIRNPCDVTNTNWNYKTVGCTRSAYTRATCRVKTYVHGHQKYEKNNLRKKNRPASWLVYVRYYYYYIHVMCVPSAATAAAAALLMGSVRVARTPPRHNAPNALRPIDRGQWRAMQNTPPYHFPTSSLLFRRLICRPM